MLLVRIHRKPFRPILKVPTIGELTAVSHVMIGMALAGAGYHLVVHALGLPQFRGPLRLALVISGIFIVCTILADGFDVAGEEKNSESGDEADASAADGFREPEKWSDRS